MNSENSPKLPKLGSKVKIRSWEGILFVVLPWIRIRTGGWLRLWVPSYVGQLRSRHVLSPCKNALGSGPSQETLKEHSAGTLFHLPIKGPQKPGPGNQAGAIWRGPWIQIITLGFGLASLHNWGLPARKMNSSLTSSTI